MINNIPYGPRKTTQRMDDPGSEKLMLRLCVVRTAEILRERAKMPAKPANHENHEAQALETLTIKNFKLFIPNPRLSNSHRPRLQRTRTDVSNLLNGQ